MRTQERLVAAVAFALGLFASAHATAESVDPRRAMLGVTVGPALPLGSLEEGSRTSDTVFGTVPVRLDAGAAITRQLSGVLSLDYAVGIPTLCASTSDCTASLATDVLVLVGARHELPRLGPVTPELGWGFGYEWFTSRMSDKAVTSSRHFRGPAIGSLEILSHFWLGRHSRLAPTLRLVVGEFSHATLAGPGGEESGPVNGLALHGWISLGARLGFDL